MTATPSINRDLLAKWLLDSRRRASRLVEGLDDEQLVVPRLATINPPLWELGHLAWFSEHWVLRRNGEESLRPDADRLYDSSAVPHDTRWDLPLPTRRETLGYLDRVYSRMFDRLDDPASTYFLLLSIFHADMHDEAFAMTRQALGYPALSGEDSSSPRLEAADHSAPAAEDIRGDVVIPGGRFPLGAGPGEPFVFDNEKWAHPVEVRPFAIARACVTQSQFAAFVDEGGYSRREFWDDAGWRWRESVGASQPIYWRREGAAWLRCHFGGWLPLEPDHPIMHVCWHEAQAYCRWARRRLPTEAEWEVAAATEPGGVGAEELLSGHKRRFPWGEEYPDERMAKLDGRHPGCAAVGACSDGDSAWGCRQMLGNVWEWTASDFTPYPGFVVDPYADYSRPWFGTHKVLRGGCWLTRARLLRNTFRNFYRPERRDVWAGFRTCALP
jgi:iron(II)-dependent oxidoreductase